MAARHTTKKQSTVRTRTQINTTLLDLVWAVNQVTDDDQLVAATVAHMVNNGQARLTGTFKNARLIVV